MKNISKFQKLKIEHSNIFFKVAFQPYVTLAPIKNNDFEKQDVQPIYMHDAP